MLALEGAVPNGWVGSCVCETDDRDLDQMTCYQRIKKKKDKRVAGPIGEGGESSGTGEFCTLVEKARKE